VTDYGQKQQQIKRQRQLEIKTARDRDRLGTAKKTDKKTET